jgi:hypothetical protein
MANQSAAICIRCAQILQKDVLLAIKALFEKVGVVTSELQLQNADFLQQPESQSESEEILNLNDSSVSTFCDRDELEMSHPQSLSSSRLISTSSAVHETSRAEAQAEP